MAIRRFRPPFRGLGGRFKRPKRRFYSYFNIEEDEDDMLDIIAYGSPKDESGGQK